MQRLRTLGYCARNLKKNNEALARSCFIHIRAQIVDHWTTQLEVHGSNPAKSVAFGGSILKIDD